MLVGDHRFRIVERLPQTVQALTLWARMWKYSPPGQAEYSLVDVPTVMGTGIAAQTIAFSDFVLGVDKAGASPFAGKFTYGPIPTNADFKGPRSAGGEPGVPIRTSSFAMAEFSGAQAPFYAAMKDSMSVMRAKPKVPKIFEIYDALGPIVQQVGLGKLTPEQGARLGQEKMLAICTKCSL